MKCQSVERWHCLPDREKTMLTIHLCGMSIYLIEQQEEIILSLWKNHSTKGNSFGTMRRRCVRVFAVGWRTDLCHWFQIAVTSLEVDVTVYLAFSSYQVIPHWWFFTSLILLFHVFTSFSNCFACVRGNLLITGSWKQLQGSKEAAFHSSEQKLGMFHWNTSHSWSEIKFESGLTCILPLFQSRGWRSPRVVVWWLGKVSSLCEQSLILLTHMPGLTWFHAVLLCTIYFFFAKYERCVSSHCQRDGRSFSLWPVLKGFVLKLCSPFCFVFSSQFWPTSQLPAALWATSTEEFRVAQVVRVRHQRACMDACLRTICPLHKDLGEALCGGRQAQPVSPDWATALGSLNQRRPGTGLIHPGVPSI